MIQVTREELKSGMVLAKSIYRDNGELLLASGYPVDDKLKNRLCELDLPTYWIHEKDTELIVPVELLNEQIAFQSVNILAKNHDLIKKVADTKSLTQENVNKLFKERNRFHSILLTEKIKQTVCDILDDLLCKNTCILNLNTIHSRSSYSYTHALDTTLTAILLAQKLQWNRMEIEEMALGCLMMDMGMAVMPPVLLEKKGDLTFQEFTLLKEHTTYGFLILRENTELALTSAHVAFQHHERQDGTGYPRRLLGDNNLPQRKVNQNKRYIHRYAEVVAVADTYVSLIAPKPGSEKAQSPDEAIRSLIEKAGTQLNRTLVDQLITLIPLFPVGTRVVVIEDKKYNLVGYTGIVARYRHEVPDKPAVMLTSNRKKEKISGLMIDLLEEPGIKIQFVVLS